MVISSTNVFGCLPETWAIALPGCLGVWWGLRDRFWQMCYVWKCVCQCCQGIPPAEHHPPELFFHLLWTSDEPSMSVLLALVLGWGLHGKMMTQRSYNVSKKSIFFKSTKVWGFVIRTEASLSWGQCYLLEYCMELAKPKNPHQDSPEEQGAGMGRLSFCIKIKHIIIKLW